MSPRHGSFHFLLSLLLVLGISGCLFTNDQNSDEAELPGHDGVSPMAVPTAASRSLDLTQTEACHADAKAPGGESGTGITILGSEIDKIISGKKTFLIFDRQKIECLMTGGAYVLQGLEYDFSTQTPYKWGTELHVMIEKIELAKDSRVSWGSMAQTDDVPPTFFGETIDASRFYVIQFKPLEDLRHVLLNRGDVPPMRHPLAETVSAEEAKVLLANHARAVEIRGGGYLQNLGSDYARKFHLPGALALTMWSKPQIRIDRDAYPPSVLMGVERLRLNIPDKNTPIIVHGFSSATYRSYNAITFLSAHGFKNIYWLRGGILEWFHVLDDTPAASPQIAVADAQQVNLLRKGVAYLLDVRGKRDYSRGRIFGASEVEFVEKKSNQYAHQRALRANILTIEQMKTAGDRIDLSRMPPPSKIACVVTYGEDEHDWRPLKAAIWAKSMGYQVYWYRKGWLNWDGISKLFPSEFPEVHGTLINEKGGL